MISQDRFSALVRTLENLDSIYRDSEAGPQDSVAVRDLAFAARESVEMLLAALSENQMNGLRRSRAH